MLDKHQNPDGTYNGLGVLGDMTGLSKEVLDNLWKEVKANHARLASCAYHEFELIPQEGVVTARIRDKYLCKHCGGTVDANAHHWHEQGRRQKPQSDQ